MSQNKHLEWWENNGGFFGNPYMTGDDSISGYLPDKQESLEERTQREVDGIVKILKPNKSDLFLDAPCGYGRHTIELYRRGYRVIVGVDINEEHLKKAKEDAKNIFRPKYSWETPHFEARDIRTLKADHSTWDNHFHHVINLFFSFGFFENEEDNIKTMESFYGVLRNGGDLLIHTDVSQEMILQGRNYRLSERRGLRNRGELLIEENYEPSSKRLNGSWTIYDAQGNATALTPYSMKIYSAEEFRDMATNSGFSKVNIYGSFDGDSFTPNSNEMIIVATKI